MFFFVLFSSVLLCFSFSFIFLSFLHCFYLYFSLYLSVFSSFIIFFVLFAYCLYNFIFFSLILSLNCLFASSSLCYFLYCSTMNLLRANNSGASFLGFIREMEKINLFGPFCWLILDKVCQSDYWCWIFRPVDLYNLFAFTEKWWCFIVPLLCSLSFFILFVFTVS